MRKFTLSWNDTVLADPHPLAKRFVVTEDLLFYSVCVCVFLSHSARRLNQKARRREHAGPDTLHQRLQHAPAPTTAKPPNPRRWFRRSEPMDHSRPRGKTQGVPLQSDPTITWWGSQVGGLGVALLHHQLPRHCHPWRWPPSQAWSDHRDLGSQQGLGTARAGEDGLRLRVKFDLGAASLVCTLFELNVFLVSGDLGFFGWWMGLNTSVWMLIYCSSIRF